MNKNYVSYLFKSKKVLVGFIAIVEIVMTLLIRMVTASQALTLGPWLGCMWINAVGSYILCFAMPIYLLKFLHSKKAADTYFALPITRKELLSSCYIFEYITIVVPLEITTLLGTLLFKPVQAHSISFSGILLIMLVEAFIVFVLLALNSLIVMVTNTTLDALIISAAYHVLPFVLMMAVTIVLDTFVVGFNLMSIGDYYWLSPDIEILRLFERALEVIDYQFLDRGSIGLLIYLGVLGTLCFLGSYKLFDLRKAENAEEKSSSMFAYPLIRHLYVAILLLCVSISLYSSQDYTFIVVLDIIILVFYIISGFVYERKLAINKKNIIFAVATIVLAFLISILGFKTKGFGLSYSFNRNYESLSMQYRIYEEADIEYALRATGLLDEYNFYSVEISLDVKKADDNLKDLVINLQKDAVDQYYEERSNGEIHSGNLTIYENKNEPNARVYSYYSIGKLDLDTLKELAKYGTFQASGWDENNESIDMDVTKYFK